MVYNRWKKHIHQTPLQISYTCRARFELFGFRAFRLRFFFVFLLGTIVSPEGPEVSQLFAAI
jgi:hypothetical protein